MMKSKSKLSYFRFSLILVLSLFFSSGMAQKVTVSGVVKDAQTNEVLPFSVVSFTNSTIGTSADSEGFFTLTNKEGLRSITISSVGYSDRVIELINNVTSFDILLQPSQIMLEDVVVRNKQRYSRKNNPAIDFMREVIARKDSNNITSRPNYNSERYEKFITYLDKFNSERGFIKRTFANYIDTSEINGRRVVAMSIKESLSNLNYRKSPRVLHEEVFAKREEGIFKDFDETTNQQLQELFRDVNLYDNNIDLFYTQFVSPLSSTMALTMYKYFIEDTVTIDDVRYLKMLFFPFSQESIGFKGALYFTLDGNYALKKSEIQIPNKANLNFAKDLTIHQNYEQIADSVWVLSDEELTANLYLFTGIPELLIRRVRSYRDYHFTALDNSAYRTSVKNMVEQEQNTRKSDEFWVANRHIPLKQKEQENAISKMVKELQQMPLYKTIVRTSEYFSSGYLVAGRSKETSKFNIGPLGSIFSTNEIEGLHFRLGGTTTANLSRQLFASGYLAYGVYDKRLKYNAQLSYSFNKKEFNENEFPRDKISVQYGYDLFAPGSEFQQDKDNFFVSWRVGNPVTKMSYLRRGIVSYEKDLNLHFYGKTWLKHQIDEPTGMLQYRLNDNGTMVDVAKLTTFEWGLNAVYRLEGRPFDVSQHSRLDLTKRATEFSLSHYMGFKNVLGSQYNYQRTELSAKARIQMSAFGYINGDLKLGKIWTKTPFPMLYFPNAYQSIILQPNSFLMI